MYINQCRGGYPIPITQGGLNNPAKLEILGVMATVSDVDEDSRLTLIDDYGQIASDTNYDLTLVDIKGVGGGDSVIGCIFPEPLKTRKGVAVTNITNLIQGSILLYVR